jgi:ATP-dependent protease ClpP protease subunit
MRYAPMLIVTLLAACSGTKTITQWEPIAEGYEPTEIAEVAEARCAIGAQEAKRAAEQDLARRKAAACPDGNRYCMAGVSLGSGGNVGRAVDEYMASCMTTFGWVLRTYRISKEEQEQMAHQAAFRESWQQRTYNIDKLKITVSTRHNEDCKTGEDNLIELEGEIGPDSTFAMKRLLEQVSPCVNQAGQIHKIVLSLRSGGGVLRDGFELGKLLRSRSDILAVVDQNGFCASSCAVAFLGAQVRVVADEASVVFHAPYYQELNTAGEIEANCNTESGVAIELMNYYTSMIGVEDGLRLFDRTMSYCSVTDGWVLRGGDAAKLFGVSNFLWSKEEGLH